MSAASVDLSVEQGAYWDQQLVWKDANGDPVDLTGYTADMQVRENILSPTVIVELTTENDKITLGGALGTIDLVLTAAETAALGGDGSHSWVYDLQLNPADDEKVVLARGRFNVVGAVTRA
jgi:hypothetical protein